MAYGAHNTPLSRFSVAKWMVVRTRFATRRPRGRSTSRELRQALADYQSSRVSSNSAAMLGWPCWLAMAMPRV